MDALDNFITVSREEFDRVCTHVDKPGLNAAADLISDASERGNRLHITGIGKPSHVAAYAAALISSTGTPAYYLHGTEAVHGSCGQLREGDVVICISKSGETEELKSTAMAARNNGCRIIAVTESEDSWLGKFGEICLKAFVEKEGGPLNRAGRTSVIAQMFILQCLSVLLQERVGMTHEEYVKRHPGGAMGKL